VKLGILCENYYPTLGGEQEHIFNLRRHLESPVDGSAPVDVRVIVPHVAYDVWHGPADDGHVLRPAQSIRVHGEGSASQITITPSAYGALRRLFGPLTAPSSARFTATLRTLGRGGCSGLGTAT
jgi:hypothetical protein